VRTASQLVDEIAPDVLPPQGVPVLAGAPLRVSDFARVDDWAARGYAPRERDYQRGAYGRGGFTPQFLVRAADNAAPSIRKTATSILTRQADSVGGLVVGARGRCSATPSFF